VAPKTNLVKPGTEKAPEFEVGWPVVFEHSNHSGEAVAHRLSREAAEATAAALNDALKNHAELPVAEQDSIQPNG
jgi:hypothetical protein